MNKYLIAIAVCLVVHAISVEIVMAKTDVSALPSFALCNFIPAFLRKNTNLQCSNNRTQLEILYNGTLFATRECQYHFRYRPWNCSTSQQSLPPIVNHAFPETAYLYSIHSAGLAFSLAEACASGKTDCICKRNGEDQHTYNSNKQPSFVIEDKKCTTTSLKYGVEESRKLLRNNKERDIRSKVDEHNKEAGRLAITGSTDNMNKLCFCQGISGACAITKCILSLPKFRKVSEFLMEKYNTAVQVGSDNYGRNLIPSHPEMRKPTKNDLLFMENSPKFCEKNLQKGSLGTKGRICIKDSKGPDGCDKLCCNRGYTSKMVIKQKQCYCKFDFCCKVHCKTCKKTFVVHKCS